MTRSGARICRYQYDDWYEAGHFYVKVTGIEYERSNYEAFFIAGRRKMRKLLVDDGLLETEEAFPSAGITEWDRSYNMADGLLETITFRTIAEVGEPSAAVA